MSYGSALFTKAVERNNLPGKVTCGQKRHTSNPTKPALNSKYCWQGFRRSEKTHQKPEGLAMNDRTRAAKAQPGKTHMCRGYLLSDVHLGSSETQCQLHSTAEIRGLEQQPTARPAESNPIFGNGATVCREVVTLCGSVQGRLCRIVQNIKAVFTHTRASIVDGAAFGVRMLCSPAACAAPVRRLGGRDIQADPIHVVKRLQHVSFHHVQLRGSHGHEWRTEKSHHQQPVLTGQIIWTECAS